MPCSEFSGLTCIAHQVSSRGRKAEVRCGVCDLRAAQSYLRVRRAARRKKTPQIAADFHPQQEVGEICRLNSRSFGDLARADTPRAHLHVLWPSVHHRAYALKVGQPASLCHVMGVRDIAPGHWARAADFTSLRHCSNPPRDSPQGVELNSTGGPVLQVSGTIKTLFFSSSENVRGHWTAGMGVEFHPRKGGAIAEYSRSWRPN